MLTFSKLATILIDKEILLFQWKDSLFKLFLIKYKLYIIYYILLKNYIRALKITKIITLYFNIFII
jgi:hypothetical protein